MFEYKYNFNVEPNYKLMVTLEDLPLLIKEGPENVCTVECKVYVEPDFFNGEPWGLSINQTNDGISITSDEFAFQDCQVKPGPLMREMLGLKPEKNHRRNVEVDLIISTSPQVILQAEMENGPLYVQNLVGKGRINVENSSVKVQGFTGELEVEGENGPIKMENLAGPVKVSNENGPIRLQKVEGDVRVTTENGPVHIEAISGNIRMEGENNPFRVNGARGETFYVLNENGSIRVIAADYPKATVKNENGSIYYEMSQTQEGNYTFANENGRITLIIPDEVPVDLQGHNEWGSMHLGIPGTTEKKGEEGDYRVRIVRGSGKAKIDVGNENGSIVLLRKPEGTDPEEREKLWAEQQATIKEKRGELEALRSELEEKRRQLHEKLRAEQQAAIEEKRGELEALRGELEEKRPQLEETSVELPEYPILQGEIADMENALLEKEKELAAMEKQQEENTSFTGKVHVNDRGHRMEFNLAGLDRELNRAFNTIGETLNNINIGGQISQVLDGLPQKIQAKLDRAFGRYGVSLNVAATPKEPPIPPVPPVAPVPEKEPEEDTTKLKVLEMLAQGRINVDEAERLLKALEKQNG